MIQGTARAHRSLASHVGCAAQDCGDRPTIRGYLPGRTAGEAGRFAIPHDPRPRAVYDGAVRLRTDRCSPLVGSYTAEQFDEQRFEFPDGGRWHELESGELLSLQPPEALHGAVVLNLARAIGEWLHARGEQADGYTAFDIGLIVARCPDTVLRPPISYFAGGSRFSHCGESLTDECPRLVVEVASTNDRRSRMRERVRDYLALGVETIWVAEPERRELNILRKTEASLLLAAHHTLRAEHVLPGFSMSVRDIFFEPE